MIIPGVKYSKLDTDELPKAFRKTYCGVSTVSVFGIYAPKVGKDQAVLINGSTVESCNVEDLFDTESEAKLVYQTSVLQEIQKLSAKLIDKD